MSTKKKTTSRKRPAEKSSAVATRKKGEVDDVAATDVCTVGDMFTTTEKEGKVFLDFSSFPSYVADDVWSILQDCGFEYRSGFRNEEVNIMGLDHEDSIRKHLVRYGLPSMEDVEEEHDIISLKKWVAFANVPLKQSDAEIALKKLALPSDHQALTWLGKLGFQIDGETGGIYRPRPLTAGTDEFDSIDAIRKYIRSVDDEILLATANNDDVMSPRKRARRTTRKDDMPLKERDLLALRLWGAISPAPLPVYGEEGDEGSSDGEEETHPSQASSGSQCIIL